MAQDIFDLVLEPPTPTLADRKKNAANNLTMMAISFAANSVNQLNAMYAHVWENPDRLTPEQVCDALGNQAASLFKRHGAFVGFVYQFLPQLASQIRLPPSDATITYETDADGNETGRVTITRSE